VSSVVLDASALLAFLQRESGADLVERHLAGAALSAVNYSEVLKKVVENGGSVQEAAGVIQALQLEIIPFDERQAMVAAALLPKTQGKGLSFADRACLTLESDLKAALYTTDRRIAEIDAPVRVVLIREAARQSVKRK
jgi:ribonuclease VapC